MPTLICVPQTVWNVQVAVVPPPWAETVSVPSQLADHSVEKLPVASATVKPACVPPDPDTPMPTLLKAGNPEPLIVIDDCKAAGFGVT